VGGLHTYLYSVDPFFSVDPLGLAGYRVKMDNIAGDDTLSRGVHVNIWGPGLPDKGGHIGIVPNESGDGLTMKPVDSETKGLSGAQLKRACECVNAFMKVSKNYSKLEKQALAGIDQYPGTARATEMALVRKLAQQGVSVK